MDGMKNLYRGFAISAPGANTGIISGGIDMSTVGPGCQTLRLQIELVSGTSSVVRVTRTVAGVKKIASLNNGIAITAACTAAFDIRVESDQIVNFELVTNVPINSMTVDGIYQAVA